MLTHVLRVLLRPAFAGVSKVRMHSYDYLVYDVQAELLGCSQGVLP